MDMFKPLGGMSSRSFSTMVAGQVILAVLLWSFLPMSFLPRPTEIATAWVKLMNEGFIFDIWASLRVTLEAILITTVISLGFAYLAVFPFFRPVMKLFSKFRFNGLVGLTLFFTLLTSGGHELKLALMVFGTSVWFLTAMSAEIEAIPKDQFDHARTLGMSEWRVMYEVVILGTADKAFEILRQNTAIGWMMLTMVEGMVRSEGGVGAMLLSQSKYLRLDAVFAIQITVLVIGIFLDEILGFLRRVICPYSALGKER